MATSTSKKKEVTETNHDKLLVWGWEYLEADFLRYYGKDLYKLIWVDKISSRKFRVLLTGLPGESAWSRFLQDKDNYSLPLYLT